MVVVMRTACEAPGAARGVMVKGDGVAVRPVATGTDKVQLTRVVVPLVKVATTLGVVVEPATIVLLVGLQATE